MFAESLIPFTIAQQIMQTVPASSQTQATFGHELINGKQHSHKSSRPWPTRRSNHLCWHSMAFPLQSSPSSISWASSLNQTESAVEIAWSHERVKAWVACNEYLTSQVTSGILKFPLLVELQLSRDSTLSNLLHWHPINDPRYSSLQPTVHGGCSVYNL